MADTDWTTNPGDPAQTDEQDMSPADVDAAASEAQLDGDASDAAEAAVEADGRSADDVVGLDAGLDAELDADLDASAAEIAAEVEGQPLTGEATAAVDGDATTAALQSELDERTEDLKRVTAEFTNYRRRVERDRAGVIAGAKADLALHLLPVIDDLELAEAHGDLTGPLKAVSDKLGAVLTKVQVEGFGAAGEEFDANLHEAVQDTSTGEVKVIGTVLRKGYRVGDRVLRTAMVIIADPE